MENCQNLSDETIIEAIKEKRKNKIALEEWEIFLLHEYWKDWYHRRMKGKRKVTITSFGDVSEKLLFFAGPYVLKATSNISKTLNAEQKYWN